MPCTYTGSLEGDEAMIRRQELDRATRVACELAQKLDPAKALSKEAQEWIAEHQKRDARMREAAR